jgi:hypothetical protein
MLDAAPLLRLEVLTDKPVRAREAGLMIERLANAFDQQVRSKRLGDIDARLGLSHLSLSSLFADFGVLATIAYVAFDQRQALVQFVSFLADSIEIIAALRGNEVPPADRSAIEALAVPVARENATQVNVFVIGDNENRIEIGRELAETLTSALVRPRSLSDGELRQIAEEIPLSPRLERRIERHAIDYSADRSEHKPADPNGTMIYLNDRWFVRPEGMNGGMLPAEGFSAVDLDPSRTYVVQGRILTSSNLPTGFVPTTVHGPLT